MVHIKMWQVVEGEGCLEWVVQGFVGRDGMGRNGRDFIWEERGGKVVGVWEEDEVGGKGMGMGKLERGDSEKGQDNGGKVKRYGRSFFGDDG